MPSRNARGNRRRGRAGICAIPAVKKNVRNPGMASGKKPFARRGALRSCTQSGDRAAADGCPRALKPRVLKPRALRTEFPHPFCASGPADRGVDQGVRFYRSRPVRRGQHHYCRGRTVCDGAGDGGIARPRVSSGQVSGCRWLMTGLTCAGPVHPVTPPQGRPGTTPRTALPCPPS